MSDLVEQLHADLDDVDLWEVYGDALQERGDPRGEMLAWSVSLARSPDPRTAEAIRTWLGSHVEWAEPVSQDRLEAVREPLQRHNIATCDLAMGHVRHLTLTMQGDDDEVAPWWAELLPRVAVDPLTQFARSAMLHVMWADTAAATFGTVTWPIRALTVWADASPIPPLPSLLDGCPRLDRLALDGRVRSPSPARHPRVRRLVWTLGGVYDGNATDPADEPRWLFDADLPALEELLVDRRLAETYRDRLADQYGSRFRAISGRDRHGLVAHAED